MKAPQKIGILFSISLSIFFCFSPAFGEGVALSWETYNPQKDPAYHRLKTERTVNWDLILRTTQEYERTYSPGSRQSSQPRLENQSALYRNQYAESRSYPSVDMSSAGYMNYYGFYPGRYDPWLHNYQLINYQLNSHRLFWWSLIPLMNLGNFQNHNSNYHH